MHQYDTKVTSGGKNKMVDFQMMKSPVRWTLFLIFVVMIVTIILGINYTLIFLNIHLSSLIISIVAGLFSGLILIIFDFIVIQGLEYEENERERRMKTIVEDAMHSPEVRCVIGEEIRKVLNEKNKK